MTKCRIYLFTYNRPNLLPRAVNSLINQTYKDWVCEVHNDLPGDHFPAQYISSLNDGRFTVIDHPVNLGGVKSFNLAFAGCEELYASMLEDDNWWEPDFLSTMIGVLDTDPQVQVAWCNMRLWQEQPNGEWKDTGRTNWPITGTSVKFNWPQPAQALSALHSTSAMLYRGSNAASYQVPENTLLNAVELVRERTFDHPMCLVQVPLANFAITLTTNRSADPYLWIAHQLMMLASFISTSGNKEDTFKTSLSWHRDKRPTPVSLFFLVNMFFLKKTKYLLYFNLSDWFAISKWLIRNGVKLRVLAKHIKKHHKVYEFLERHTHDRYTELKNITDKQTAG